MRYRLRTILIWLGVFTWSPNDLSRSFGVGSLFLSKDRYGAISLGDELSALSPQWRFGWSLLTYSQLFHRP